jgi:hypothetical protein
LTLIVVVVVVVELSCVHNFRGFMDFFLAHLCCSLPLQRFSLLYSAKIKIDLP